MTRRMTLTAMLAGAGALIAPTVLGTTTLYVWNASESVPIGLYVCSRRTNCLSPSSLPFSHPNHLRAFSI